MYCNSKTFIGLNRLKVWKFMNSRIESSLVKQKSPGEKNDIKKECQQPGKGILPTSSVWGRGVNGLTCLDAWAHPPGHSTWSLSLLVSPFSHPNNLQSLHPGMVGTGCLLQSWDESVACHSALACLTLFSDRQAATWSSPRITEEPHYALYLFEFGYYRHILLGLVESSWTYLRF